MSNTNVLSSLLQRINAIQEALEEVAADVQDLLDAEEVCEELSEYEGKFKNIDTSTLLPKNTIVTLSCESPDNGIGSVGDTARIESDYHKFSDKYIQVPVDSTENYRLVMLTGRDAGCVTCRYRAQFTVNE